MNYLHDVTRAEQRMAELMREAETNRLMPTQVGITNQLLTAVGTWMINTGERLTHANTPDTDDKQLNFIKTANG